MPQTSPLTPPRRTVPKPSIDQTQLTKLRNEIKMAETLNEQELKPQLSEAIARYGGTYIPQMGADWDIVINEMYPIIQFWLPSIFFRNPRAFLKPRTKTFIKRQRNLDTGQMEDIQGDSEKSANTQENIINYVLNEIPYKEEVRRVLMDALLAPHGILWHGYKGEFGMTEERSLDIKKEKVFVKRISPLRFLKDPSVAVSDISEGKWVARSFDIPLQDLVEDDKLDVDKKLVKGFKAFGQQVGTQSQNDFTASGGKDTTQMTSLRKPLLDFADKDYKNSELPNFVRIYEVFLRPTKKEEREGKKGKILLLTDQQKKPLRVNDWTIKAEGFPVQILAFNHIPDAQFGLSDMYTYKAIADMKNIMRNLQCRNAQENSKVWVGLSKEGTTEEEIDKVKDGDQTIITFEEGNVRDRMQVMSPGGQASNELYLIDGRLQREMEDKSGVSDLKKGFLQSGEESATSVSIRNAGSSARPQYRQDLMSDFLEKSIKYLLQLEKQFLTVQGAVRIMGSLDIEWSEKPTKEEIQADVDVEIDVISMLPENPEKELKELNTILMMMIQALQDPATRAKIAEEGNTFNISPIIEQILQRLKIRNPDVFRRIKPEESEGSVQVQQLREAQSNIQALIQGSDLSQIPAPPKEGDDHRAKIETYTAIAQMAEQIGMNTEMIQQLIMLQQQLLQQQVEKEDTVGQPVKLNKPKVETF